MKQVARNAFITTAEYFTRDFGTTADGLLCLGVGDETPDFAALLYDTFATIAEASPVELGGVADGCGFDVSRNMELRGEHTECCSGRFRRGRRPGNHGG